MAFRAAKDLSVAGLENYFILFYFHFLISFLINIHFTVTLNLTLIPVNLTVKNGGLTLAVNFRLDPVRVHAWVRAHTHMHAHSAIHFDLASSAYVIVWSRETWSQTYSSALHQTLLCSTHKDPHSQMRQLLCVSLPVHPTASRPHSLAYLSNPGLSFPMKCSLFETEKLTSTNGCIFSRALWHKMILLLSPFSETGNGIAEIGRSTLLKASANLRKHKAWFFRVLISIALYLVTVQVPFDSVCNHESFTLVSGRRRLQAEDWSDQQHVISAHLWGVWPDQRHPAKFPSEASWAGKALKNLNVVSSDGK